MSWFAIRTVPGAQLPRRVFVVEETNSRKGYRIVPDFDAKVSAVERALSDAGFDFWMPVENRLLRDRKHTDLWKPRRFALMVGYMFVQDPENWPKLLEVPGVAGVVRGMDGRPLPVDIVDMLMVRSMEALAQEEFDRQVKRAQSIVRRKAKDNPRLKRLVAEFDKAGIMTLPVAAALAA